MIELAPNLFVEDDEIQIDFLRSSGPGGQNVNKVATAVQLRFQVKTSPSLSAEVKERLKRLAGKRMTEDGVLIIEARRFRTQEKNRADANRRLGVLVLKALEEPKIRKKTKPGVTASAARVDEKKRRGVIKKTRHYNPDEWE